MLINPSTMQLKNRNKNHHSFHEHPAGSIFVRKVQTSRHYYCTDDVGGGGKGASFMSKEEEEKNMKIAPLHRYDFRSSQTLFTDMKEKEKARLRESRLLAPSGRGGRIHAT